MAKGKKKTIFVRTVTEDIHECPICKKVLVKNLVPRTDGIVSEFCCRCHIYYARKAECITKDKGYNLISDKALKSFKRTYEKINTKPVAKPVGRIISQKDSRENIGKPGFCIKCGEKCYNKELYCFECFKQQRSE